MLAVFACVMCMVNAFARDVNREKREVTEFTRIEVSKGANISLIQADRFELEVVTEGCPTADVETIVKGDVLTVKMKKKTKGSAVEVFVYFKDIESVKVKSGASVTTDCSFDHKGLFTLEVEPKCEADMELYVDELNVVGSSCSIELRGKATKQKVEIAGTFKDSKYDAESLVSDDVEIYASGCGAVVNAQKTLNAEAVGSDIKYVGDPEISKKESSGGSIGKN